MREADNKSIFLSVVGVYVVRTLSLNDKHSCQLFRKASSFVLLSCSVSTANLSYNINGNILIKKNHIKVD